jgi:hypothetical protein
MRYPRLFANEKGFYFRYTKETAEGFGILST